MCLKLIHFRQPNLCFIITINFCFQCLLICLLQAAKCIIMTREQPEIIDRMLVVQAILHQGPKIWNSLPISISCQL